MKDTIVEAVIEQLNSRSKIGIKKYGVTLDRTDLSTLEWIQHAQEEAMDLCLYLEKIKQELKPTETLESHTYHTDKNGCYNKKKENWYDDKLEERINIIGQNGNEGLHYEEPKNIINKMKQTAVEWLSQQTLDNWNDIESGARNITEFIEQAKEIEKQQERSYSDEEVLVLLNKRDKHNMDNPETFNGWQTPKEWFEQFKNK